MNINCKLERDRERDKFYFKKNLLDCIYMDIFDKILYQKKMFFYIGIKLKCFVLF